MELIGGEKEAHKAYQAARAPKARSRARLFNSDTAVCSEQTPDRKMD